MYSVKLAVMFFALTLVLVPALDEADQVVPENAEAYAAASEKKYDQAWQNTVAKEKSVKQKAAKQAWSAVKGSLSSSELTDKTNAQALQRQQKAKWAATVAESTQKSAVSTAQRQTRMRAIHSERAHKSASNHAMQQQAEQSWQEDKAKIEAKKLTRTRQATQARMKAVVTDQKDVENNQKEAIQKSTQKQRLHTARKVNDKDWNEMMQKTKAANQRLQDQAEGIKVPAAQGSAMALPAAVHED